MAPLSALLRPVVVGLFGLLLTLTLASPADAAETDPVGVWPLQPEPEVVTAFDPPDSPWGPGHRGVDLLGAVGQAVHSALPGRVSFAGMLAGRGVVVIDHGSTRTTYEPVGASVAVGDDVASGERIGRLSYAGSHCLPRPCLHWGWIEGAATYLDPLRLVGAGPVRLLPLWRDAPVNGSVTAPLWHAPPLPYADWQAPLRLFLSGGPLS